MRVEGTMLFWTLMVQTVVFIVVVTAIGAFLSNLARGRDVSRK
ncbi:hypothetical protein [Rhodoplanes azumiensis]|uniref:Uncharacterized protein n=1 Tax=Rhodoplanes azumiensis TaxID=1897628 RepID=A0ABW5AM84_9BRAD